MRFASGNRINTINIFGVVAELLPDHDESGPFWNPGWCKGFVLFYRNCDLALSAERRFQMEKRNCQ